MNSNPDSIDFEKRDVLKEIANIGAGHAATALAALLERPIVQSVPDVMLIPFGKVSEQLGGAEKLVVAGLLDITGDISGFFIVVLEIEQADKIISMMLGKKKRPLQPGKLRKYTAIEKSVIGETVNILGGSYLTAISELTNLHALPSTPYLCADMVGAVLNIAIAEAGKTGDFAIFFQSELFNEKERIIGDIFLIPDQTSCDKILQSLGFI
ncbi:chemotaxis protein CheC [Sporobacter termitidis DSM 10068]|uniref:Chemotaxis protein CheC n=1 Tax=Sporobacter termitidis DSM 10068 TaxID=1123282 RepID=A0A1M5W9B9_9FIRM|nr:chemotaxis protein CheC [Sporobacter termitidis]SHH84067.1 chemotaxis protein CheC [Sporobacter termitidis DSM 10068]